MSLFLCISIPKSPAALLESLFDPAIFVEDASGTPIGELVCKNHIATMRPYFLRSDADAVSMVNITLDGSRLMGADAHYFIEGVQMMANMKDVQSVSFIAHWYSGDLQSEDVPVRRNVLFFIGNILAVLDNIEEDVLYTLNI